MICPIHPTASGECGVRRTLHPWWADARTPGRLHPDSTTSEEAACAPSTCRSSSPSLVLRALAPTRVGRDSSPLPPSCGWRSWCRSPCVTWRRPSYHPSWRQSRETPIDVIRVGQSIFALPTADLSLDAFALPTATALAIGSDPRTSMSSWRW